VPEELCRNRNACPPLIRLPLTRHVEIDPTGFTIR
jgi:hypothetical protein